MNASAHFVAAEGRDYALDLPPVAESQHIAGIATAFGARRGLESGVVPETLDEFGCVRKCDPACDERRLHAPSLCCAAFPEAPQTS